MVAVPGMPRAMYFPGNPAGKPPSSDGPDVLAYKRTVSRAGRWPWTQFNDTYTEEFACGRPGGNVPETGVAGVQRQLGIEDTGQIGEATFNGLRSIRIPEGLPHAGEPAMDATAANLIAEAYYALHPPPPPKQTTRERALAGAQQHIGYTEQPAGSNHTVFGSWYGMDYQPWCAMFVTYCYEVEAGGSPTFVRGSRFSYVPYIVGDARNGRNGLTLTDDPVAGDLVCYDWEGDNTFDHIGLFEEWSGGRTFFAVEGNTSTSSNSNGGEVMRRSRDAGAYPVVFCRVN
jgi:hypothetical protein